MKHFIYILVTSLAFSSFSGCGFFPKNSSQLKDEPTGRNAGIELFSIEFGGDGSPKVNTPFSGDRAREGHARTEMTLGIGGVRGTTRGDGQVDAKTDVRESEKIPEKTSGGAAIEDDKSLTNEAARGNLDKNHHAPSIERTTNTETVHLSYNETKELKQDVERNRDQIRANVSRIVSISVPSNTTLSDAVKNSAHRHNTGVAAVVASSNVLSGVDLNQDYPFDTPTDSLAGQKLAKAVVYRNYVANDIANDNSEQKKPREDLLEAADLALQFADYAYQVGDTALGDEALKNGLQALDLALSFVPGVGLGKDLIALGSGINPITGKTLSDTERAIIMGALLMPAAIAGTTKVIAKTAKVLGKIAGKNRLAAKLIDVVKRSDNFFSKASSKSIENVGEITDDVIETFGERAVTNVSKSMQVTNKSSSEIANDYWVKQIGYKYTPYKPGSVVLEVKTTSPSKFFRVHGETNQQGAWLMDVDPRSLGKSQVRNIYSLTPNNSLEYVSEVSVPAGVNMRIGEVASIKELETQGGAIQYELLEILNGIEVWDTPVKW